MEAPEELLPLLSCVHCRRHYQLGSRVLPRQLNCGHHFCERCLANHVPCNVANTIVCPSCHYHTNSTPREVPYAEALLFLIRQVPALILGRAMMNLSSGGETLPAVTDYPHESEDPTYTWLNEIAATDFLSNNNELCVAHNYLNSTWCHTCQRLLCPTCALSLEHKDHFFSLNLPYRDMLQDFLCLEMHRIQRTAERAEELAAREMGLLRQICEALSQVQLYVRREMLQHRPTMIALQMRRFDNRNEASANEVTDPLLVVELERLLGMVSGQRVAFDQQLSEVYFHCRLRAAIQENGMQMLELDQLNKRLLALTECQSPGGIPLIAEPPPAVLLTNYCVFNYWSEMQGYLRPRRGRRGRRSERVPPFNPPPRNVTALANSMQEQLLRQHPRSFLLSSVPETISGPVEPMSSGPVQPMSSGPVEPMSSRPVQPMSSGPVQPMSSGPVERMSSAPVERMSSAPVEPMSSGPVEPSSGSNGTACSCVAHHLTLWFQQDTQVFFQQQQQLQDRAQILMQQGRNEMLQIFLQPLQGQEPMQQQQQQHQQQNLPGQSQLQRQLLREALAALSAQRHQQNERVATPIPQMGSRRGFQPVEPLSTQIELEESDSSTSTNPMGMNFGQSSEDTDE